MKEERELAAAMDTYGDTVKRLCVVYLKNQEDTEDIFQSVFLKYWNSSPRFESEVHEKAWIIRVTINACKDLLRNYFRKNTVALEEVGELEADGKSDENGFVRRAVLSLPEKYRIVIYLHYFEEYSAVEIGKMLSKNTNTVYTLLSRGREMLKQILGGDPDEW